MSAVRAAAAASLRELVEVLEPAPELGVALRAVLGVADPVVRAAALEALRALRLGETGLYAGLLADPDQDVRIHAVRALVSVDAVAELARAAQDGAREVRVAVAKGLAAVRAPARRRWGRCWPTRTPLVRGAALAALATTGCPAPYAAAAVAALADPTWQVRAGAAAGLRAADPAVAVPALAAALGDPDVDVRKAAVLSLLPHGATTPAAREALATAITDPDADVRAYASRT
ncbi:HEAT repeat domain-containing protein [Streptomyces sp. HUAS TT3]|uniref:HEAT repeat domain-containing protein n=1 Tax=Streptomyces sp. HUAS TT3 TaxID=3447510 RepID=UPI003F657779